MATRWRPRNAREREAADRAVKFISLLKHTRGKWAGIPFELLPWEEWEVVRPIFGTLGKDGQRTVRTSYIEVGKKQGKSELAAAIALKLLFADDEQGGEVYGAAVDRDQATIVFNVAAQMVRQNPTLTKRCKIIDSSKRILVTQGKSAGSFYRAIPADAAGSDGYSPSGIIFDEVHRQPNRELWDVLTDSTAARSQPLTFAITTAGYDRNSLAWDKHEYARQVREGVIKDPSFLSVQYAAAEGADFRDVEAWKAANPSIGHTVELDFYERQSQRAAEEPAYENSFRRFFLNQWVSQESRWLPMTDWDACAAIMDKLLLLGKPCYAGLDMASTTDLAAFVLVFPPQEGQGDGRFRILPHFWLPEENLAERIRRDGAPYDLWARDGLITLTPGNVIDYQAVKRDVHQFGIDYGIQEIAADPYGSWQLLHDLEQLGFQVLPFRQGFTSLGPPTRELLRMVKDRTLAHDANPVLRWMCDNIVVEQDAAGNWKPSKRKSTKRIDGVVAMVMGIDRAMRHMEYEPEGYLVYDERVSIGPNI
jgi:phage terminase large subunit-like protein